jgi:hypothetical protein
VTVGVCDGVTVGVRLGTRDGVTVGVLVGTRDGVTVGVGLGTRVAGVVGVWVDLIAMVGVGVALSPAGSMPDSRTTTPPPAVPAASMPGLPGNSPILVIA